MVVGNPEVEHDRPHDRMDEALADLLVGEAAEVRQPPGQFRDGRGLVQDQFALPRWPDDGDALVVPLLQAAHVRLVGERVGGHDAVQLQHVVGRQRVAALGQLARRLHGVEVVEDHPLALVDGASPAAQELGGNAPRRGGPLQQARGDGLLLQGGDEIACARPRGHHLFVRQDLAARLLVDTVRHLLDLVGVGEAEGRAVGTGQWQGARGCHPAEGHAQPPPLARQSVGRRAVAHLVPVQVAATGVHRPHVPDDGQDVIILGHRLLQQFVEGGRRGGFPHGTATVLLIFLSLAED